MVTLPSVKELHAKRAEIARLKAEAATRALAAAHGERRLKPLGYELRYHIPEYRDGMPGDVVVTLSWE